MANNPGNFNLSLELNAHLNQGSLQRALSQAGVHIKGFKANIDIGVPKAAIQQLAQINASMANTSKAAQSTTTQVRRTASSFRELGKEAGLASYSMRQFGYQASLALKRYAAYSVAVTSILGAVYGFKRGVGEAVKFETSMIKVAQVTNRSVQSLDFFQNKITEVSKKFGASSRELIGAARILAQAGLTAKEVEKAVSTLAKTDLAPTFDSIAESAEGAIAIMRQFKIQAGELERVFGSLNAIAGSFAVESADLIAVIRRAGGAFAAASKDLGTPTERLNELLALFTAVRSTTRESADSIGTGFRTIFTRMQRPRTLQFLRDVNIELSNGSKFVGPFEAIRRLNLELSKLDPKDYRFTQIIEELGGFRQVSKVIPLIQQFPEALKALAVAEAGATSLTKDAKIALTGLEQQLKRTKEEFQSLFRSVTGSDVFRDFAESALKLASSLAKVAETLIPVLPALASALAVRTVAGAFKFGQGFVFGPGAKGANIPQAELAYYQTAGRSAIRRQRGGRVPGTGKGDTVPAWLESGEFVIRSDAAKAIGYDQLAQLNKMRRGGFLRQRFTTQKLYQRGDASFITDIPPEGMASIGDVRRVRRRLLDPQTGEQAAISKWYARHRQERNAHRQWGTQRRHMREERSDYEDVLPIFRALKAQGLSRKDILPALRAAGIKGFATGGMALLEPGEFVLNRAAVNKIGLHSAERLNQADRLPGFKRGGRLDDILNMRRYRESLAAVMTPPEVERYIQQQRKMLGEDEFRAHVIQASGSISKQKIRSQPGYAQAGKRQIQEMTAEERKAYAALRLSGREQFKPQSDLAAKEEFIARQRYIKERGAAYAEERLNTVPKAYLKEPPNTLSRTFIPQRDIEQSARGIATPGGLARAELKARQSEPPLSTADKAKLEAQYAYFDKQPTERLSKAQTEAAKTLEDSTKTQKETTKVIRDRRVAEQDYNDKALEVDRPGPRGARLTPVQLSALQQRSAQLLGVEKSSIVGTTTPQNSTSSGGVPPRKPPITTTTAPMGDDDYYSYDTSHPNLPISRSFVRGKPLRRGRMRDLSIRFPARGKTYDPVSYDTMMPFYSSPIGPVNFPQQYRYPIGPQNQIAVPPPNRYNLRNPGDRQAYKDAAVDQAKDVLKNNIELEKRMGAAIKVRTKLIADATIEANKSKLASMDERTRRKTLRQISERAAIVAERRTRRTGLVASALPIGPQQYPKQAIYGKDNASRYKALRQVGMSKEQARYLIQEHYDRSLFTNLQRDDKTRGLLFAASNLEYKDVGRRNIDKRHRGLKFGDRPSLYAKENLNNRRRQQALARGQSGRGGVDPFAIFAIGSLLQGVAANYGDNKSRLGNFLGEASNVAMSAGGAYLALNSLTGGKRIDLTKLRGKITGGKTIGGNLQLLGARFGQNKAQNIGRVGTAVGAGAAGAFLYAGAQQTAQARELAKTARSDRELAKARQQAQAGGLLSTIGGGASLGVAVGSIGGPLGMAVGAALGGLLGVATHYATNEIDKEINAINIQARFDESVERIGSLTNMRTNRSIGIGQGSRALRQQLQNQFTQLDLATGDQREQLEAQLKSQAPVVQEFINQLASSSTSLANFKNGFGGAGTALIAAMSRLSGQSFANVEKTVADMITAQQSAINTQKALNQSMSDLRREITSTITSVSAYLDATDKAFYELDKNSTRFGVSTGSYGMPQFRGSAGVAALQRPGQVADVGQFMRAVVQGTSMFSAETQSRLVQNVQEEVAVRNALPDILLRVASRSDIKGDAAPELLREELEKQFSQSPFISAIANKFAAESQKVEAGPGAFLREVEANAAGIAAQLIPESQSLEQVTQALERLTEYTNRVSEEFQKAATVQREYRGRLLRGTDISTNADIVRATLNKNPALAAQIEADAAKRRQLTIASPFGNVVGNAFNPQALGARLSDVQTELDRANIAYQQSPTLDNQKAIARLMDEAEVLGDSLRNLADSTDRVSAIQRQWEIEEGKRRKRELSVEDYLYGDSQTRRQLDRNAGNFQRLLAGGDLTSIPRSQRGGVLEYMRQFEGDPRFDDTRKRVLRAELTQQQRWTPEQIEGIVNQTVQQEGFRAEIDDWIKLQKEANDVLASDLQDTHTKLVDGIDRVHTNFLNGFERISLEAQSRQLQTDITTATSQAESTRRLRKRAGRILKSDFLTKYGIESGGDPIGTAETVKGFVEGVDRIRTAREKEQVYIRANQLVSGNDLLDVYTNTPGKTHKEVQQLVATQLRGLLPETLTTTGGKDIFNQVVSDITNQIRERHDVYSLKAGDQAIFGFASLMGGLERKYSGLNVNIGKEASEVYKDVRNTIGVGRTDKEFATDVFNAIQEIEELRKYADNATVVADLMKEQNTTMTGLTESYTQANKQADIFKGQLDDITDRLNLIPQPIPRPMAMGGSVFRTHGTDTVPAMLTPGEFIVNRRATAQHLPLLRKINAGQTVYAASGGMIGDNMIALNSGLDKLSGSTMQFSDALNRIVVAAQKLSEAAVTIPHEITLTGTHTVEVRHLGLSAITGLDEHIKTLVVNAVNRALKQPQDTTKPPSMR